MEPGNPRLKVRSQEAQSLSTLESRQDFVGPHHIAVVGYRDLPPHETRPPLQTSHSRQVVEVRIGGLQIRTVVESAGGNQDIGCRRAHSLGPRLRSQFVSLPPNVTVDRQIRENPSELPQHPSFVASPGTVPEFQLHDRTPACFPALQRRLHARVHAGIAIGPKEVDP